MAALWALVLLLALSLRPGAAAGAESSAPAHAELPAGAATGTAARRGRRISMEDRVGAWEVACPRARGERHSRRYSVMAVCDGHGGAAVSTYLYGTLWPHLQRGLCEPPPPDACRACGSHVRSALAGALADADTLLRHAVTAAAADSASRASASSNGSSSSGRSEGDGVAGDPDSAAAEAAAAAAAPYATDAGSTAVVAVVEWLPTAAPASDSSPAAAAAAAAATPASHDEGPPVNPAAPAARGMLWVACVGNSVAVACVPAAHAPADPARGASSGGSSGSGGHGDGAASGRAAGAASASLVAVPLLTQRHELDDPAERARVEAAGGRVEPSTRPGGKRRLMGDLEVSRAFGDLQYRNVGLSAEPELSGPWVIEASGTVAGNGEGASPAQHALLVLASDGATDVMQLQDMCDHAAAQLSGALQPPLTPPPPPAIALGPAVAAGACSSSGAADAPTPVPAARVTDASAALARASVAVPERDLAALGMPGCCDCDPAAVAAADTEGREHPCSGKVLAHPAARRRGARTAAAAATRLVQEAVARGSMDNVAVAVAVLPADVLLPPRQPQPQPAAGAAAGSPMPASATHPAPPQPSLLPLAAASTDVPELDPSRLAHSAAAPGPHVAAIGSRNAAETAAAAAGAVAVVARAVVLRPSAADVLTWAVANADAPAAPPVVALRRCYTAVQPRYPVPPHSEAGSAWAGAAAGAAAAAAGGAAGAPGLGAVLSYARGLVRGLLRAVHSAGAPVGPAGLGGGGARGPGVDEEGFAIDGDAGGGDINGGAGEVVLICSPDARAQSETNGDEAAGGGGDDQSCSAGNLTSDAGGAGVDASSDTGSSGGRASHERSEAYGYLLGERISAVPSMPYHLHSPYALSGGGALPPWSASVFAGGWSRGTFVVPGLSGATTGWLLDRLHSYYLRPYHELYDTASSPAAAASAAAAPGMSAVKAAEETQALPAGAGCGAGAGGRQAAQGGVAVAPPTLVACAEGGAAAATHDGGAAGHALMAFGSTHSLLLEIAAVPLQLPLLDTPAVTAAGGATGGDGGDLGGAAAETPCTFLVGGQLSGPALEHDASLALQQQRERQEQEAPRLAARRASAAAPDASDQHPTTSSSSSSGTGSAAQEGDAHLHPPPPLPPMPDPWHHPHAHHDDHDHEALAARLAPMAGALGPAAGAEHGAGGFGGLQGRRGRALLLHDEDDAQHAGHMGPDPHAGRHEVLHEAAAHGGYSGRGGARAPSAVRLEQPLPPPSHHDPEQQYHQQHGEPRAAAAWGAGAGAARGLPAAGVFLGMGAGMGAGVAAPAPSAASMAPGAGLAAGPALHFQPRAQGVRQADGALHLVAPGSGGSAQGRGGGGDGGAAGGGAFAEGEEAEAEARHSSSGGGGGGARGGGGAVAHVYRLRERFGQGHFGEVFRAWRLDTVPPPPMAPARSGQGQRQPREQQERRRRQQEAEDGAAQQQGARQRGAAAAGEAAPPPPPPPSAAYVLKRLRGDAGAPVLLSGLREAYFGGLLTRLRDAVTVGGREEERGYNHLVEVVESFEVLSSATEQGAHADGAAGAEAAGEGSSPDLWLVFGDAGRSLHDLLYSPVGMQHHGGGGGGGAGVYGSSEGDDGEVLGEGAAAGGPAFQVMGPSPWWHTMRSHPRGNDFLRSVLRQLLLGLQAVHEANVTHRDIKPENMMIVPWPRPREAAAGTAGRTAAPAAGSVAGGRTKEAAAEATGADGDGSYAAQPSGQSAWQRLSALTRRAAAAAAGGAAGDDARLRSRDGDARGSQQQQQRPDAASGGADGQAADEAVAPVWLRLIDFGSAVDDYSLQHLYGSDGPTSDELTLEYAPPEALFGRYWEGMRAPRPRSWSYDIWSAGVVWLELIMATPQVWQLPAATRALLEARLALRGRSEGERAMLFLLRGLMEWCIYPPQAPSGSGPPLRGRKTRLLMSWSCTEEALLALARSRDPLGVGLEGPMALRLLLRLLHWDPASRPSARQALQHAYFTVRPAAWGTHACGTAAMGDAGWC